MTTKTKALILYASYGDGHLQTARALKESFEAQGFQTVMADLFAEAHPVINRLTRYFYLKSYAWFPRIYGWLYSSTKNMGHDSVWSRHFHAFGIHKLRSILDREKPQFVINTFPMLVMPELNRRGVRVPCYTVITDFTLHRRWVHPDTEKFYVATDGLKKQLSGLGIPAEKICASGIPIKKMFCRPADCGSIFRKFNLSPGKKTLLIMAGAYGVLRGLSEICRETSQLPGVQTVIVCGNNETLQEKLEERFAENPNIRVLGFVKDIHELMSVSSCLVTKPGGITLSEALCANLPIVLFRPVPGQERENAEYLVGAGAAVIAESCPELIGHIRLMLRDTRKLEGMRGAIRAIRTPRSAETVATDVADSLRALQERPETGLLQQDVPQSAT